MIKLHKSPQAPKILLDKGIPATEALCALFDSDPSRFGGNRSSPPLDRLVFESHIYGHPNIKKQLIFDQNEKCAFCESKILAVAFGDVEHFRPKGGWQQSDEEELQFPGYYWLAYQWENLLFACEKCNQAYKKNHFPLLNPGDRVTSHCQAEELPAERPAVIDPYRMDPSTFLTFKNEMPQGIDDLGLGTSTIKRCGLDRRELCDARSLLLELIEPILVWLEFDPDDPIEMLRAKTTFKKTDAEINHIATQAKSILEKVALDKAPYAAVVRAKFPILHK